MFIELKNFGPISYFKFDLSKDLHAIFGKNNIGKSYALSSTYLIIKNLIQARYAKNVRLYEYYGPRSLFEDKESTTIQNMITKIKNSNSGSIRVESEIEHEMMQLLTRDFLIDLNQSFANSYSFESIENKYSKEQLEIIITSTSLSVCLGFSQKSGKLFIKSVKFPLQVNLKKINSNRKTRHTNDIVTIYYNSQTGNISEVKYFISRLIISFFISFNEIISNVYFLPASRSGLYNALSTFGAIMAELSQSRNFLKAKIELPNISEPVSDYFINLSSIKATKVNNDFTDIAKDIESEILKGNLSFNSKTKKYSYRPTNLPFELDLSVTSSMIAEIAPIVAHLKYIIDSKTSVRKKQTVLFIEEPEAHLHPEIQIKLIEFFVRLLNINLKVVFTSHSNYIFNKLSNLIISKQILPEKINIGLMEMSKVGSIINKEAMSVDSYGISDNNFADIAEKLYEERIDLIDKLNAETDN